MKVIRLFISIVFFVSFFTFCKKDKVNLAKLTSNHSLAIPLVSGEISVNDMLKSDTGSLINTGSAGELFLVYITDPISFSMNELAFTIPDVSENISVTPNVTGVTIPIFALTIDTSYTETIPFSFDINGVTPELKEIDFSDGILSVAITNQLDHEVTITLSFPSLLKNSITPYSVSRTIPANDVSNDSESLIPYILDLTQGNAGFNELLVDVQFTVTGSGQPLAPSDFFEINLELLNLDYSQIIADIGNHRFDLDPIEFSLDIFNNSSSAINFQLTNPEISFDISNSSGLSPYLGMDTMYYEDLSGVKIADLLYDSAATSNSSLVNPDNAAPFYFPSINSSSSTISINNDNSSIGQLINDVPKTLKAQPFLEINPDPSVSHNNIITSGGEVNFSSEVMLPLEGYAGGWSMGSVIEFDFQVDSLFSGSTAVDTAEIKFRTTNGWPVDVTLTINLYDVDPRIGGTGSDSLSIDPSIVPITSIANQEIIIESGIIGGFDGKVTQATVKNTIIKCDYDCVQSLNETKFVNLSAAASTENYNNQQAVKIYDDYALKINMALLVHGKLF
jgi:hypothetical protein